MDKELLESRMKELQDSKINFEIEYHRLMGRISEVQYLIDQANVQKLVDEGEKV
jgi:hypothetical protein